MPRSDRPAPTWPRQKILALLIGAAFMVCVLLTGVVIVIVTAVRPHHARPRRPRPPSASDARPGAGASAIGSEADRRAKLAELAMPSVGEDASHPGTVSTADPGTLLVPGPTRVGAAQVPTGFPHTPTGALAQLAAIDQTALNSVSIAAARSVIEQWAAPGGPTGATWSVIRGLGVLLGQLGVSAGSSQVAIVLTPVMGLIKGTVGPDFVVPCIDFELDVTLQQTARGATADCQRMVWAPVATGSVSGRWLIGPGPEPMNPPSVWPDTDLAVAVGYQDLQTANRP